MKAVGIMGHGGPEVLQVLELPLPEPGPGQVRVHVQACALNHLDLWVRRGLPNLKLAYPHVLGSDIAGTTDDGELVIVNPGVSCMACAVCLSGQDSLCRKYRILGEHIGGGYAQVICVPRENIVPRPANLPAVQAAAFPLTMLTAWEMLVNKARVRPNEDVLVLGAGSGIGVAAIQIAKLHGARVIACSTSPAKCDRAEELGADDVLDTSAKDFVSQVKALTGGKGADIVVEHVGQATWQNSLIACAKGGRIVTCGATSGFDATTDLRHVFFRQLSILGSTMGRKGDLFQIAAHVAAGRLAPVVDRVFPLADAAQAHAYLEAGQQFGKVVLSVE